MVDDSRNDLSNTFGFQITSTPTHRRVLNEGCVSIREMEENIKMHCSSFTLGITHLWQKAIGKALNQCDTLTEKIRIPQVLGP